MVGSLASQPVRILAAGKDHIMGYRAARAHGSPVRPRWGWDDPYHDHPPRLHGRDRLHGPHLRPWALLPAKELGCARPGVFAVSRGAVDNGVGPDRACGNVPGTQ